MKTFKRIVLTTVYPNDFKICRQTFLIVALLTENECNWSDLEYM